MKLIITFITSICIFNLNAQDITGIWRGKFQQTNINISSTKSLDETYKYEVQINNKENGGLEGVTYSYLNTRFYGKAALKGISNTKNKTITIKETLMLEIKASGNTLPCLMTCYLDYKKSGSKEILSGTYTSVNSKTNGDCGVGTVYLEKVVKSDFQKESFLSIKKKPELTKEIPKKSPIVKKEEPKKNTPIVNNTKKPESPLVKNDIAKKPAIIKPKTPTENKKPITSVASKPKPNNKKTVKPNAEDFIIKKEKKDTVTIVKNDIKVEPKVDPIKEDPKPKAIEPKVVQPAVDDVLIERENKLINTYVVNTKEVILAFYDNGQIDNDTITVYKDNKLVIDSRRLTTNPITLTLKFDELNTFYEIITVANNLGDIPPNTALMVINYGKSRKEVGLTSDEKTNAKIIVKYQP